MTCSKLWISCSAISCWSYFKLQGDIWLAKRVASSAQCQQVCYKTVVGGCYSWTLSINFWIPLRIQALISSSPLALSNWVSPMGRPVRVLVPVQNCPVTPVIVMYLSVFQSFRVPWTRSNWPLLLRVPALRIQGYTWVYKGIEGVYKGIQGYTRVKKHTLGYTGVYNGIQGHIRVYKGTQVYTRVYKGLHEITRVYVGIYTTVY